ncbi:hypothetical protein [Cerasicoccus frondis]|uniref:hypothetical protein n=1 Tax=Cerasicoccus frondis TaxID=490090 RepID=UPI00285268E7|nr:hypothetical protein [Cerasicoccus frondis]
MDYILSLLLALVVGELFYRAVKLGAHLDILRYANRSVRVMSSSVISDHWKERVLLMYSRIILAKTLILAGVLLILILLVAVFIYIGDLLGTDFGAFLSSWTGIIFLTVIMVVISWLRKRFG